eukprot:scaffold10056_cov164-Amphora_coffeaeformis.AAC.11
MLGEAIPNGLAPFKATTYDGSAKKSVPHGKTIHRRRQTSNSISRVTAGATIITRAYSLPMPASSNIYDTSAIKVEEISIKDGARKTIFDGQSSSSAAVDPMKMDPLLGIHVAKGTSVVAVSNLLARDEIDYLVESSLEAAATQQLNNPCSDDKEDQGQGRLCVRMPTVAAANRHDIPDVGSEDLHDPLPLEVSQFVEERILQRAMAFIDQHLPDVRKTLFGSDCDSLLDLFLGSQLEWSTREPAINVYYPPNGYFGIHKDNKALTILMPLHSSKEGDFTGGGTAFWSQSHPNEHQDAPSLILAPLSGTALLFGGKLPHKGLRIETGVRTVFVASFSRRPKNKHKSKTRLVSAR